MLPCEQVFYLMVIVELIDHRTMKKEVQTKSVGLQEIEKNFRFEYWKMRSSSHLVAFFLDYKRK